MCPPCPPPVPQALISGPLAPPWPGPEEQGWSEHWLLVELELPPLSVHFSVFSDWKHGGKW